MADNPLVYFDETPTGGQGYVPEAIDTNATSVGPDGIVRKVYRTGIAIKDNANVTFGGLSDVPQNADSWTSTSTFMRTFRGFWRDSAKDGTDATGVSQLASGVGIRGWLSGIFSGIGKQTDTPAASPTANWGLIGGVGGLWAYLTGLLGATSDTAATSSSATTSYFSFVKRSSANEDTAIAAIGATNTREGTLGTSPPAMPAGASGKLGAIQGMWQGIVSLFQLVGFQKATGTLGALNATATISGGPYGAVGFALVGTSVQTISAFGTRDGTTYNVPLGIITEPTTGGSTSGTTFAVNGAGPFFGYVESAGCSGVQLLTSAYTSGSLAVTLTATAQVRSLRMKAPLTDPINNRQVQPATSATKNVTAVTTATAGNILTTNALRFGYAAVNDSTSAGYLLEGPGIASATNYTIPMPAGSTWKTTDWNGAVSMAWVSVNGAARVTEYSA